MEAFRSKRISTYSNGTYQVETFSQPPTEGIQYWMHKEDIQSGVFLNSERKPRLRSCATQGGCPAVFILLTPTLKMTLNRQWQYYLIAINYNMTLENVFLILDDELAFCNGTGFRGEDKLRNYILGRDLNAIDTNGNPAYPKFDKDRTCSRSILTGVVVGDRLKLHLLNGNALPPLKPGKFYPQTVSDINPDDYLYHPKNPEHRHLFFAANMVASKPGGLSSVSPFPRGAIYNWTGDGLPYTWLPHVSRHTIYYPLSKLQFVENIPSPYRIVR